MLYYFQKFSENNRCESTEGDESGDQTCICCSRAKRRSPQLFLQDPRIPFWSVHDQGDGRKVRARCSVTEARGWYMVLPSGSCTKRSLHGRRLCQKALPIDKPESYASPKSSGKARVEYTSTPRAFRFLQIRYFKAVALKYQKTKFYLIFSFFFS